MESLARFAAGIVLAALAAQGPLNGTFALVGGKAASTATLNVRPGAGSSVVLDVAQTAGTPPQPLRKYSLDMTKLMHMIVISDDFSQFRHVHPTFDAKTGNFTQALSFDPNRRYYIYVDSQPAGLPQQVFRFSYQSANAPMSRPIAPGPPSPLRERAGPYDVMLAKTTLPASTMQMINVTVTKNGKPAADLKPYLGAAAHAVFINTATLEYVHVHPVVQGQPMDMDMSMPGMTMDAGPGKAGPKMTMHVPPLPAGTYRLWLQFRGGSNLYVAPFTLAVHWRHATPSRQARKRTAASLAARSSRRSNCARSTRGRDRRPCS